MADVIVESGVATATATASGRAATATSIWVNHARIAVRHEAEAHEARERLRVQHGAGEPFDANEEFEASLVAITHAALAIDGLYGCVEKIAPIEQALRKVWSTSGIARHRWIVETLKRRFRIGGGTNRWPKELEWLFDLRDGNVHFVEDFRESVPHPVIGSTSHERTTYSPEKAKLAVDLMLEVTVVCTAAPRPEFPALVDYTRRHRPLVDQVVGLRRELQGRPPNEEDVQTPHPPVVSDSRG